MDIKKALDFYFSHAKASRYYVVFKDADRIIFYDFSALEFRKILDFSGVCKLDTRSDKRKDFDGKKQTYQIRLQLTAFRRAVCAIYGDNFKGCTAFVDSMTLADYEKFESDFCAKFNCTLKQKDDTGKHYTHGDCMEYLAFCKISGDGSKWYKNTRSYKSGTDCNVYEIKGFGFGAPTLSPQVNQYI